MGEKKILLNQVRAATSHVSNSSLEGDISTFGQDDIFSLLFDQSQNDFTGYFFDFFHSMWMVPPSSEQS